MFERNRKDEGTGEKLLEESYVFKQQKPVPSDDDKFKNYPFAGFPVHVVITTAFEAGRPHIL